MYTVIKNNQIGRKVYHKAFGYGTINNVISDVYTIKFDDEKLEIKQIKTGYFKILTVEEEQELKKYLEDESNTEQKLDDMLEDDETISSDFKILPSNYSKQTAYSRASKEILTTCRRNIELGVATIQAYKSDSASMGVIINEKAGVIIFKLFDEIDVEDFSKTLPMINVLYNQDYELYKNKFMKSKKLLNSNQLKFDFNFIYIFQKIQKQDLIKINRGTCNQNFVFRNFLTIHGENYLSEFAKKYSKKIDKDIFSNIIERIVPENVTLLVKKESTKKNNSNLVVHDTSFKNIIGDERLFDSLNLEDEQITTINNTKPGHYLTLANPGTGKSVILLSKAYRIASENKNARVLITAYNTNLIDKHNMLSTLSGLKNKNLHVLTMYGFLKKLVDDYELGRYTNFSSLDIGDRIQKYFNLVNAAIDRGTIPSFLDAIFIDEVQLLEPQYLEILYRLLRSKEKSFFELFGDLNQDVRSSKEKGKASWQTLKLNWQGRTKYCNVNYRNTTRINDYINNMIDEFNNNLYKLNPQFDFNDAELCSNAVRKGKMSVQIFNSTPESNKRKVLNLVNQLHDKFGADYSEIAILIPARQWKPKKYYIYNDICDALTENGIQHSTIAGENKVSITESDGVTISTIESALGLDFKYVILCGTYYWNYFFSDGLVEFDNSILKDEKLKNKALQFYCNVGRQIYGGVSRAREGLLILDDLPEKSPIRKILRPSGDVFNEK